MFTTGRIIFASIFVVAFVILMIFSYKKDAKNNKKYYQNSALYVAIGLAVTIGLLFLSITVLINYASREKVAIAFASYDFYSIGFLLLMYLFPLQMLIMNDLPFIFKSEQQILDEKHRVLFGDIDINLNLKLITNKILNALILLSFLILCTGVMNNFYSKYIA